MTPHELRLKEARAALKMRCKEYFLTYSDFCEAKNRYDAAKTAASNRDKQELDQWRECEQSYRSALRQWYLQQSWEATVELSRRKTWHYQLVRLLVCLLSCGLFLIVEMRVRKELQRKQENPPLGPLQRTWTTHLEEAQRHMAYLCSLQDPRPTQQMREAQEEVRLLQKKRDMLYHQVLLQEERFNALQQHLSSSSTI